MYNEAQKARFIQDLTDSISSRRQAVAMFNQTAKAESALGRDVSSFSAAELQDVLTNEFGGFRKASVTRPLRLLRKYHDWCAANGVPDVSDAIVENDFELGQLDRIRRSTVKSPAHLALVLDRVFEPEENRTADNMLRGFLWTAFSGVPETVADRLTKDNFRFDDACIAVGDTEYPIYRESIRSLKFCCASPMVNRKIIKGSRFEYFPRPRSDGDSVFRTEGAGVTDYMHMRSRISHKMGAARKAGLIDADIAYGRVLLSGQYYRMYERETAGLDTDFRSLVDPVNSLGKVRTRNEIWAIQSLLKHDYELWKQTLLQKE